ncbi:hypothetical protein [Campylobacter phage CP81]|uniref:Uncharacterized protein n=1 Tax=Campylobacter phage CP81 TaxID=2927008 RepID=G0LWM0_9CAUD|nr:hypothetical protein FDJ37_gp045 [Campylobacter phage CP81]CBZ42212.1 hypothetical protein [Campylobacter phage CP81]
MYLIEEYFKYKDYSIRYTGTDFLDSNYIKQIGFFNV